MKVKKPIGIIAVSPRYPKVILTRCESLNSEAFAEFYDRFRRAFPEARWVKPIYKGQGAWVLPADRLNALKIFYIGLFGTPGFRLENPGGYVQLKLM